MRTSMAAVLTLALVLACGSEAAPTSAPIPIFDPTYQAFMVDVLEQEIAKAEKEGNDAVVECLALMQETYIRWEPADDDLQERCEPIVGTLESETAQPW